MNSRGNIALSIISALMFFACGMLLLNFVLPEVDLARGVTGIDCSSSSLTDGQKITCIGIDGVVPFLIITIFSVALGKIAGEFA